MDTATELRLTEIHGKLKEIGVVVHDIKEVVQEVKCDVKAQNGRVRKNEQNIAAILAKKEVRKEVSATRQKWTMWIIGFVMGVASQLLRLKEWLF